MVYCSIFLYFACSILLIAAFCATFLKSIATASLFYTQFIVSTRLITIYNPILCRSLLLLSSWSFFLHNTHAYALLAHFLLSLYTKNKKKIYIWQDKRHNPHELLSRTVTKAKTNEKDNKQHCATRVSVKKKTI